MIKWALSKRFVFHLLPIIKKQEGTKIIISDNLTFYMSVNVIKLCEYNSINFVCLPPNSSHSTHPLDVVYSKPLKSKWRDVLSRWKESDAGKKKVIALTNYQFPPLTAPQELEVTMASNLQAGLKKKPGICPPTTLRVTKSSFYVEKKYEPWSSNRFFHCTSWK